MFSASDVKALRGDSSRHVTKRRLASAGHYGFAEDQAALGAGRPDETHAASRTPSHHAFLSAADDAGDVERRSLRGVPSAPRPTETRSEKREAAST